MELTLEQALQKGIAAHKAGQVQEADRYYTAILEANPKHSDANHNMGVLAVGVGKVTEALPFFKTALEVNPNIAQYWLSYIDALIKLDRLADAKAVLDQAKSKGAKGDGFDQIESRFTNITQTKGDQTDDDILRKAIDLRESGKYDEAIDLLLHQTKQSSKDPNIPSLLSHCYILSNNLEKAKIYLDVAKNINPKIASVGWNETRLLLKQKKVNEALAIAEKTNKLFPDDVEGMGVLGSCLRASGSVDESLIYLNKALSINPNYAEALTNRGLIYLNEKDKVNALADLEKAHILKPHIKQIWDLLINLIVGTKNYSKAISILIKMIELDPTREESFSLLAACSQSSDDPTLATISFKKILEFRPNDAAMNFNLGIALQFEGKSEEAIEAYKKALSINPNHAETYYNMGNTLKEQGKLEEAIEAYKKALSIKPDLAAAYYNMGIALKEQGKPEEAIEVYKKALAIKPHHAEIHNNMGATLKEQGKLEEAIEAYKNALAIKPGYAAAYNNMGATLKEQGKLEEAIEAYKKALSIKPDHAEAYYNMGNTLKEQGKLEEAIEAYKNALAIKPCYAAAYNNMGATLKEQGKLEEAIEAYNKLLAVQPGFVEAWNNLVFPLRAIKPKVSNLTELASYYPKDTGFNHYKAYRATLNYIMNLGGANGESTLDEALKALGTSENIVINNPRCDGKNTIPETPLPDKVVALVHWGRSGTGLVHSLIDNHPEVSTLPSIFLSEYFNHLTWESIISDGWNKMVDRFMAMYDVIFDATSKTPVQTKSLKLLHDIGYKEGMANVGNERDEVVRVNKELFHTELQRLMSFYDQLDPLLFFKIVHKAYEKAINYIRKQSLIFYHIHNPDTHALLNFIRLVPEANWVMMVREPVQSCESFSKEWFIKNDHFAIATRIISMLFEINSVIYHKQNSIGVRLEDLKERPKDTIPALCRWMGIEETDSLYEMTVQGKRWWGDPSSPDFLKDGMDPFGKTSIKRKIGSIFSDNDQFILRTLFYPFSVRFSYAKENREQFKNNLKIVRPMLSGLFDFEKAIIARTGADPDLFVKSGSYLYLRSGLIERWETLNQFQTYPDMIKPLRI